LSVEVRNNTELSRYEAYVDGDLAGFAVYVMQGSNIVFTHTEVYVEGKGVGSTLVREALDDVRRGGTLTVVPLCPFVKAYIESHPEYADLT
jgi:uncharacterized protein